MRTILSAAGRAAGRDFAVAFVTLAVGIWAAPNLDQAYAIAGAATIAATVAAVRAVRVFVPQLSKAVADMLGVPVVYAEVIITGLTTLGIGFCDLALGVLSAPDLTSAKAAGVAGLLAVGTALTRVVQGFLTRGEFSPGGIGTPPQPVPPEALPKPL